MIQKSNVNITGKVYGTSALTSSRRKRAENIGTEKWKLEQKTMRTFGLARSKLRPSHASLCQFNARITQGYVYVYGSLAREKLGVSRRTLFTRCVIYCIRRVALRNYPFPHSVCLSFADYGIKFVRDANSVRARVHLFC